MAVFGGTELARGVLAWTTSTAPAQSPPVHMHGRFNVTLSGSATGVVADLERSFDDGATWVRCTAGGARVVLANPCTEVADEPEAGVLYRLAVSAIGAGTLVARISQ